MTSVTSVSPPVDNEGPSPLLSTLHEVERILRESAARDEGPLSLAEIGRRMTAKSVRHATVRACVDELARFHLVTHDLRHGVMWTLYEDDSFWSSQGLLSL